jgi:hypothetical protein
VGELASGAEVDHVLARRAEEAGRLPRRQQVFICLSHALTLTTKHKKHNQLVARRAIT